VLAAFWGGHFFAKRAAKNAGTFEKKINRKNPHEYPQEFADERDLPRATGGAG
jgi:hypothetical protein